MEILNLDWIVSSLGFEINEKPLNKNARTVIDVQLQKFLAK